MAELKALRVVKQVSFMELSSQGLIMWRRRASIELILSSIVCSFLDGDFVGIQPIPALARIGFGPDEVSG